MKMIFRKAALQWTGLFFIFASGAAAHEHLSTTLDVQNGLSDNCVNDVLFDSDDFLPAGHVRQTKSLAKFAIRLTIGVEKDESLVHQ